MTDQGEGRSDSAPSVVFSRVHMRIGVVLKSRLRSLGLEFDKEKAQVFLFYIPSELFELMMEGG